jgi:hypothetical protein
MRHLWRSPLDTATKTERRGMLWTKGKLLGQKPPLKLKKICAIRIRLQLDHQAWDLALFNFAIDSKLSGCDLVGLRVYDVVQVRGVVLRAMVMHKKTSTRSTLRSPSKHGMRSRSGSLWRV